MKAGTMGMDFRAKLSKAWEKSNSLLCVGLDPNIYKLPDKFKKSDQSLLEFNKAIIDATAQYSCAFKPNTAFYEALGSRGIEQLKQTVSYIRTSYPDLVVIIDAKRADIGSTNDGYAEFVFDYLGGDAVTLHPYLGKEALEPFLSRKDKGSIILCHTTNPGAPEIQELDVNGKPLYQHIAQMVAETWNTNGNCTLVVGATYPNELKEVRKIVGQDMMLLIPGVGDQGGDVEQVVRAGATISGDGIVINSSRAVIFASDGPDFAEAAAEEAERTRDEINKYRR